MYKKTNGKDVYKKGHSLHIFYPSQPYPLKCILSHRGGGRFMPTPSRLTIISVKSQKKIFDFLKLYNELGKVKFFQVSII